jgi:hypothetical protein
VFEVVIKEVTLITPTETEVEAKMGITNMVMRYIMASQQTRTAILILIKTDLLGTHRTTTTILITEEAQL